MYVPLNALMGNVMEKGGLDLSYMEVREKNKKDIF
jgi:hypothetical protein